MAAPTITAIYPDNGPVGGGTLVKVIGTNLNSGLSGITVNGVSGTSVTASSSTVAYFRTPAGFENHGQAVDVTVTTSGGTATLTSGFKYTSWSGKHAWYGDRVRETTTGTGTGNLTLAGVPNSSYKSFGAQVEAGSVIPYVVINQSANEYEVGIGTYYDDYLTRDTVIQSSNKNLKVSFSAGTKDVILTELSGYADSGREYRNLLSNSSFRFWQRQAPTTLTSRTDGQYGPDRWYVLTQTAGIQIVRAAADAPYVNQAFSANLLQNQASAQRMGLATALWSSESIACRGKQLRLQANLYASTARAIMYAVIEWTGTADSVTKDIVLDWTSSTYIAGSFFTSANTVVNTVGELTIASNGGLTPCSVVTSPVGSTCNNLIVFFWSKTTCPQNDVIGISVPLLCDDVFPRQWKQPPYNHEFIDCLSCYTKTFHADVAPVQNIGNGQGALRHTGQAASIDRDWRFPVPMRKVPSITLYNPLAANANWRNATLSSDITATAGGPTITGVAINAAATTAGNQLLIHATAEAEL